MSRVNHESLEEKAGFFSRILFLWLNPLLSLGSKRTLNQDDLPQLSYQYVNLYSLVIVIGPNRYFIV